MHGSSCVTSGAFEPVCGEMFGHILVFPSPTSWMLSYFSCSLFVWGYTPHILLCWLLKRWTTTGYFWNSIGSCVSSNVFEHACVEIFGHMLALFVSHVWNHQIQHCSIMSYTTLAFLLSCIHVNAANLLNITCILVPTSMIIERLKWTWFPFPWWESHRL